MAAAAVLFGLGCCHCSAAAMPLPTTALPPSIVPLPRTHRYDVHTCHARTGPYMPRRRTRCSCPCLCSSAHRAAYGPAVPAFYVVSTTQCVWSMCGDLAPMPSFLSHGRCSGNGIDRIPCFCSLAYRYRGNGSGIDRAALSHGFQFVAAPGGQHSSTLAAALTRFGALLNASGSCVHGAHGGGGSASTSPPHGVGGVGGAGGLPSLGRCLVHVETASLTLDMRTDESYTVVITTSTSTGTSSVSAAGSTTGTTSNVSCVISGTTVYGAMHGMESFVQLVRRGDHTVQLVDIADAPRFPFRASESLIISPPTPPLFYYYYLLVCHDLNLRYSLLSSDQNPISFTGYHARHGAPV